MARDSTGPLDLRWLLAQVGVFGPSLAALIVSGAVHPGLRRNSARIGLLFVPVLILGILIALARPRTGIEVGPFMSMLAVIVAVAVVLFFSPLNWGLLTPGTGERHRPSGGRWRLLALLFPPALFLLAWVLANLEGREWELSTYEGSLLPFGQIVLVSFVINLLFGGSLGEEIGWRGFFLPRLLRAHNPISASLILGVVWALWHAPIDLTAGFLLPGPAALLVRLVWTLPLAVLFTWFYVMSRGDLLVALILHTSLNILSDFGFSNYERSMFVLFILLVFTAILMSCSPRMRQRASG